MASLSEADRCRVRYHLGYLQTEPVSSISLGFPSAGQAQFLVERAMDNLIPGTQGKLLGVLNTLDAIEAQMVKDHCLLRAQSIGNLKIRNSNEEPTEQDLLRKEYLWWVDHLAEILGVIPNPYSGRFRDFYSAAGMNIPVRNS